MSQNPNDNLRARLDELKQENINDIVQEIENNSSKAPDMSNITPPNVEELMKPVPGGVDMGRPLMTIDVQNGTLNGQKFEEPTIVETPKMSVKEKARMYQEQNSNIIFAEKGPEPEENTEDKISAIEKSIDVIDEDSRRKSEALFKLAAEHQQKIEEEEERKRLKEKGIIDTNDIDDIIDSIATSNARKDLDVDDEEDLTMLLQKMNDQKVYADITPNKELTGPSNYIVENDESYKVDIENILKTNGMNIIKRNNQTKDAVLNRFINSGPHVSMPLINSGMFVTMSGAGTDEIIAMQQMQNDTPIRMELAKLDHVAKHIIDSSVGKLNLGQLLDVISYYDKDTLYYCLYAASYPEYSEFSQSCIRCGQQYYVNVRTRDLLLNPEDFKNDENDIKDNVTTLIQLVEKSKLGKIYEKIHSNGMIIYVKHPSIKSYLETLQKLTDETMNRYPRLVDLAYSIHKISIHVNKNDFMEFTDPNEIIEIISKFKDPSAKYEIYDMINDLRPNALPTFGIKECKCPNCQAENPKRTYDMEDMIFIQAQSLEELEAMNWAAKNQRKQKEEKSKSKNA